MALSRGKNIQLFKNPIMDWMSHVHPITPVLFWLPVVGFLYYRSIFVTEIPLFQIFAISLFGLFIWTFMEYVLHRFVFHLKPIGPISERLVYLFHGIHHDDPADETRLVMPPIGAIILASILYPLFWLILGSYWVEPFFASFLIGYLTYDMIHFSVHHFKFKTSFMSSLVYNHMTHHYKAPHSRWGVTSPLWDYVFGTLTEKSQDSSTEDQTA